MKFLKVCLLSIILALGCTSAKPSRDWNFKECYDNELNGQNFVSCVEEDEEICYVYNENSKKSSVCGLGALRLLGSGKDACGYNVKSFDDYYVKKLDTSQKRVSYIDEENAIFICKNKRQIPTLFDFKTKHKVSAYRFKENNYNGIIIESCKGNTRVTVECVNNK